MCAPSVSGCDFIDDEAEECNGSENDDYDDSKFSAKQNRKKLKKKTKHPFK